MLHLAELCVNEFQHGRPGAAASLENLLCGWKMPLKRLDPSMDLPGMRLSNKTNSDVPVRFDLSWILEGRSVKLQFLLMLAAGSAFASSVTSFVDLSCTISNVAVTCPTVVEDTRTAATGSFSVVGLDTPSIVLSNQADAEAGSTGLFPPSGLVSSASATVDVRFEAITTGPVRPGLATFLLLASGDYGAGGGAVTASASISGLGTCVLLGSLDCHQSGTLVPFLLGVPFQLDVFAQAGAFPGIKTLTGGGGGSVVSLSLFEVSGAPVTITSLPEPGSAFLLAGGLLLMAGSWKYARGARRVTQSR
jgi:hypothetical protein